MIKRVGLMLVSVLLIVGIYFAWFYTVNHLFFTYLYSLSPWFERNTLFIIILNDIVGFPLMALALWFLLRKSIFKVARYQRIAAVPAVYACIIGAAAGIFTIAFSMLPAFRGPEGSTFIVLLDYINRAEWYVFLAFLLLGNIYKETLFRGLLLNEFRTVFPVWMAIVLQGIMYGILFFQGDPVLSLYGFLGAVIFALLYVWFDSIWAPVIAQIACQGVQYVMWNSNLALKGLPLQITVMVVSILIIGVCMRYARRHRKASPPNISYTQHKGVQAV
ncbi:type II CAAX endopeptidase family protein [Paenibacillus sp. UMB4589-SE434]|uniref:CPBP family intramembrane glutamic endopeptidase n=1 Tax=Paenibacillus sp. UMB4589-SE434 TaxID=3046314 RepID=UPI00254B5959|nr:type II CAAX endopeptidase family protein [Paenibacillus sp. UMB4589-SE434]MDK8179806.1 type II CAAX endopeptidase family protein [Paenibacillus sp. UMB4589-SE434]